MQTVTLFLKDCTLFTLFGILRVDHILLLPATGGAVVRARSRRRTRGAAAAGAAALVAFRVALARPGGTAAFVAAFALAHGWRVDEV